MNIAPKLTFLWITDPWEALDRQFDTSLRLLRESAFRGHLNYWCDAAGVTWTSGDPQVRCSRVEIFRSELSINSPATELKRPADFDFVMLRADPPVTLTYSAAIRMLSTSLERMGANPESRLINSPEVLLAHSGRLLALTSPDAPTTMVSNHVYDLCRFVEEQGIAVFKSLDGHMGRGVRRVGRDLGSAKIEELVQKLTAGGASSVLAQEYFEDHLETEKRVWYVNGRILGVCRKRFEGKRFPPRLAKSKYVIAAGLTDPEKAVCDRLGTALLSLNIRLAGVDLIHSHVTDINVTSPGLLVELEQLQGVNLASRIIADIERSTAPTQDQNLHR